MPDAPPRSPSASDAPAALVGRADFYVGYLPVPPRLARWLTRAAAGLLIVFVGFGWILARAQQDPGDGVWDDAVAREFVGVVAAAPYPHLRIKSDAASGVETLLLVEVGKFGGGQRAAPLDGKPARISGWLIERDGRRMIEMEPGDSLSADETLPSPDFERLRGPQITPLGRVTLRGEIVDSKCYLGAMKPGEGKTHKECATLCIAGGIPPMLVARDADGRRSYYLLTDSAGAALDASILPLVADPVEVRTEPP
jgi:hypothetical protein